MTASGKAPKNPSLLRQARMAGLTYRVPAHGRMQTARAEERVLHTYRRAMCTGRGRSVATPDHPTDGPAVSIGAGGDDESVSQKSVLSSSPYTTCHTSWLQLRYYHISVVTV